MINYYETIIIQRPLDNFESNYRKLIVSGKYLIVLSVIDTLTTLARNFTEEAKDKAKSKITATNKTYKQ